MVMPRTRTNLELEDDHVRTIMRRYGVRTETEAVDLALRHLAGQPLTAHEALAPRDSAITCCAAASSPATPTSSGSRWSWASCSTGHRTPERTDERATRATLAP